MLTPEGERFNGRLWRQDRNPEGLRVLVEGNLRFVVKEARKYQGMGLDLLDLISEGNLGLIEAAKRYDPERENRFLTYASWWVRQAIFHALSEQSNKIRLPQKVSDHLSQLNRATYQLGQDLGRVPTFEEIANASRFTAEEVNRLQQVQLTITTVSTDQGRGEFDMNIGDSLEQTTMPSPIESLEQESLRTQIWRSLDLLNPKERMIITQHYGLNGKNPLTLDQIGKALDPPISRERVRQIEERGLKRIREHPKTRLGPFRQVTERFPQVASR